MRIPPKIQTTVFDIADWEVDAEFGVFPQGARAKDAVFAPEPPPEPPLIPGRRYLFKRSKRSYPDQFWGEVVAYRIGCLMGLDVPPAFAAWNSRTGISAALIEWFYVDGEEAFVMAGDLLQKFRPDFDRDKGRMHNMKDNVRLMRALAQSKLLPPSWQQWWVDALLFDALIGNTDRHQDNWGLVFNFKVKAFHLCPLFDNGTSLGHERFPERVAHWTDKEVERYISKGTHHVKWSLNETPPIPGHFDLLALALKEWPETREIAVSRMDFSFEELAGSISDLVEINAPVRLSHARHALMLRLLRQRRERLNTVLK